MVINVNTQTQVNHLIAKIKILHSTKTEINTGILYQDQGLLKALMEKTARTIILNGELSYTVYQQLLPLLSSPPHIYTNSTRLEKESTGRLIAVMPSTAKNKIHALNSVLKDYSIADYRAAFSADSVLIDRIEQFYYRANKFPHQGIGVPKKAELSYHRLENMLRDLKEKKLHPHNPIKGLFHYDYPDYTYLNIIAKYCLCPEDNSACNRFKLKHYIHNHYIQLECTDAIVHHVWELLNCYNGAQLREILGNDLNNVLDISYSPPKLNHAAIKRLLE